MATTKRDLMEWLLGNGFRQNSPNHFEHWRSTWLASPQFGVSFTKTGIETTWVDRAGIKEGWERKVFKSPARAKTYIKTFISLK